MQGFQDVVLDEKFRLRIPSKFRNELGKSFVIFQGNDECLCIMGESDFEKFKAPLMDIPHSDIVARSAARAILGTVDIPDEDNQGRFVVSSELRELAGIEKKVRLIGYLDTLEVWAEEKVKEIDFAKPGSVARANVALAKAQYEY
ncbi:MAG: cell division/cell wall cluster transcriptional repressor MraZ [Christensenellaceae bacterium]|nr:cell division/cell wall cluster transcriptional repressor MraZ [Christensenellaceae bacterium]